MTMREVAMKALDAEIDRVYAALERIEDATDGDGVSAQLVGNAAAEVCAVAVELEWTAAVLENAKGKA